MLSVWLFPPSAWIKRRTAVSRVSGLTFVFVNLYVEVLSDNDDCDKI
jgi:hypothetical protein